MLPEAGKKPDGARLLPHLEEAHPERQRAGERQGHLEAGLGRVEGRLGHRGEGLGIGPREEPEGSEEPGDEEQPEPDDVQDHGGHLP
jgi:hypothetical protein